MKTIETLGAIHLHDYQDITSPYLKVFGLMSDLPNTFYRRCLPLNRNSDLENFLRKINFILHKNAGDKKRNAKSFVESRFLTAQEILKRKIISCGSQTTIFTAVLRKRGIPTKLVHGKIRGARENDTRHAWLKIYHPFSKRWLTVDVTRKDFSLSPRAYPVREYRDWSELITDYRIGKW